MKMKMHGAERAYTLIEVMIAAVIVVVLALGLSASMGAAFMADAAATHAAASSHAAQQVMEELQDLDYGDVLACDGDAILTDGGVAIKIASSEAMVGMLLVEIYACRPTDARSAGELASMTMSQVQALPAASGSEVRLLTYRSGE